jgi:DNA-binding CsgD family transcriptional regulator
VRSLMQPFDETEQELLLPRLLFWEGRVAQEEGDLDLADRLFEECLLAGRKFRNIFRELMACFLLGQTSLDRRNLSSAAKYTFEALRYSQRLGAPLRAGQGLTQLACVAVAGGDFRRAAVLLGAESALRERSTLIPGFDYFKPRVPERESIAGPLGDAAFAEAWEIGRSLSMAEVMEEAAALTGGSRAGLKDASMISPREIEVLELVAQGKSNREIAETLFLSHRTVEAHMASILAKLEVDSRHKAVSAARNRGFLSTPE